MGEISGVPTTDIDNVDGFFVTQGSGSGTTTTSPTLDVTEGLFGSIIIEVTNHSGYTNPNYSVESTVGSTVTVQDAEVNRSLESGKEHLSDTLTLSDTDTTTGQRTVTVKAQDFGSAESAAVTATYSISGLPSARYIRLRGVDSSGSNSNARLAIWDLRFYEGQGQTGTSHPTNMSSATTDTNGDNFYTISAGHEYASYSPYKAFDNSTSIFNMWWALGTSAANNWIQVKFDSTEFPTPPSIASFHISMYGSGNYANHVALETSDDGSTFTQRGYFPISSSSNSQQNFG